jgi:hypothetical protein
LSLTREASQALGEIVATAFHGGEVSKGCHEMDDDWVRGTGAGRLREWELRSQPARAAARFGGERCSGSSISDCCAD